MHSLTGVVVPMSTTRATAHEAVEPLMAPYCEAPPPDHIYNESGWWDWWCVGGRYTGRYSEYAPTRDDDNYEVCWLCHGTGERFDGRSGPGNCNGCCKGGEAGLTGTGRSLKHAPDWKPCEDDVVPVRVLVNNPRVGLPLWVVLPDGTAHGEGPWAEPGTEERNIWDEKVAELLRPYSDMALVVVDIHS
jgi:hypothetical protein